MIIIVLLIAFKAIITTIVFGVPILLILVANFAMQGCRASFRKDRVPMKIV